MRLQPGTQHVIVVGGVSDFDKLQLAYIRQQLKGLAAHVDIAYVTNLAMPELLERLKHLPRHTFVLLTSMAQDAAGTRFKSNESGPMVAAAANAPVFSLFDVFLDDGEVGGYLSNLSEQGKFAGRMSLRLLSGERPQDIARVKGANAYMFDWRAIKRWGFKEGEIPPGSIVINRQLTIWEAYKQYIILGTAVIFAETLLIFALLWQRKRRKESDVQLRESEQRFRLVANTAPVMIWMSGPDKLCNYFNQPWLEFSGRPLAAELGHGWSNGVHPEDLKDCLDTYTRAFDLRESFQMQYRLRRHDGEYRWLFDIGVPRVNSDGSFAGYIGSCIDVTDRKLAEQAMADMQRKLIEAQEQERTRIGRELHDDVTQRLAFLAVELQQLQDSPSEVQSRVEKLREETSEILSDVEALSHELHSSKLQYLGVVAGIRGWCNEFAQRQNLEIDFRSDVATVPPFEIGVCLFRVLQEALHNAVKYSGVKHFEVRLIEQSNQVHLIVRDSGKGFDTESAMQGPGLGLTTMRERVRLVNGTIAIESKPMGGTTIVIRVPLEEHGSQRESQPTG
jgi:PAS domain S-box-containing protein